MTRTRVVTACAAIAVGLIVLAFSLGRDRPGATAPADASPAPTTTTTATATEPIDSDDADAAPQASTDAPAVDLVPLPAVSIGEPADFGGGVFATVTGVEATTLEAHGPGETAGNGVVVRLELRNATDQTVDLTGIAVNAEYGDGVPAIPNASIADPGLRGPLAPGASQAGLFGFRVPEDQMDSLVIDVHNSAAPNIVIVEVGDAVT